MNPSSHPPRSASGTPSGEASGGAPGGALATTSAATTPSLQEMLRVMDVAREMHRDRTVARRELAREDFRTALRDKLIRSARLSGDQVTAAEIDAAIDIFLADRYRYSDPPLSMPVVIAHLWVRRTMIAVLAGVALLIMLLWWMLSPGSPW